ncbi:MAG: hypothetical protein JSS66_04715 [Armatimonadetes bacterium]|nr:hypothetical protein [Armatimonadota bacterium]
MDSGTPRKKFQDSATSMEAYSRFSNLSGLERYAVRGDGLFDGDNVAKTLGRAFFTGALTAPFGGVGGFLSGAGASLGSQYLDYMQYHKLATADKATRQCEDLYEVAKHIAAIAKSSKATGAAEAASDLVDAAMNFKQAVAAKFRNQEVQAQNLFSGNATEMRSRFKQPGVGFRPRSTRAAQTQPHLGTATEPEEKPLIDPSRVPENLALLGKNLLTSPGNVAGYAGAVVGPQLESKAEDLYNQWNPNPGRVEDMMNEAKNIMAEIRVLANESEHETGTTGLLEYVRSATNTMYSYMTRCLRAMQSQSKPASLNTDVVPNHMFLPGQNSVYPITG